MKKNLILILFAFLFGVTEVFSGNYKVNVKIGDEANGTQAMLMNYDTGEMTDSAQDTAGSAFFQGNVDMPAVVRLIVDGSRILSFILEDGEINVDATNGTVKGGKLNELNETVEANIQELAAKYQAAQSEEESEAIYAEYEAYTDKVFNENLENPIGYMLFMEKAYEMEPAALEKFVAENPYFAQFQRVNKLLESNRNKLMTSEGKMFADFEIEYDGVKHRLSDVVGKGDYVLVDFWASWCGPCIRQTAVLKDIYKEYKDQGLKILGVAVWDEPQNTLKAIEQHELPWESWLNGQSVPTDVYGIAGIPCIILFGPDGTILSRDKQSEELKADVAKYFKKQ